MNHGIRRPGISPRLQRPVAAERAKRTTPEVIQHIRAAVGEVPVIICALTVAELAHGIHRADSPERRHQRRQFLEELKATVPIHPITEVTAEIIARIGSEQAAKGVNLPLADLIIGASAISSAIAPAKRGEGGKRKKRAANRDPGNSQNPKEWQAAAGIRKRTKNKFQDSHSRPDTT